MLGVADAGSANAVIQGVHYYMNMRENKELFCTLV